MKRTSPVRTRYLKPHLWLIRAIGVVVPRRLRDDWRQEWEAELRHREYLLADWERLTWTAKLDRAQPRRVLGRALAAIVSMGG